LNLTRQLKSSSVFIKSVTSCTFSGKTLLRTLAVVTSYLIRLVRRTDLLKIGSIEKITSWNNTRAGWTVRKKKIEELRRRLPQKRGV
jgi:hypothetical protein